jgi:hypothetical protein
MSATQKDFERLRVMSAHEPGTKKEKFMLRALLLLAVLVAAVSGCATAPKPPVFGGAKVNTGLPYSRNVADAVLAVQKETDSFMVDAAALSFRDTVTTKMKTIAPLLVVDNSPETRKKIARQILDDFELVIRQNRHGFFAINRHMQEQYRKDAEFNWNVISNPAEPEDRGSFAGDFLVGELFCFSAQPGKTYCNDHENYLLGLTGTYSYSNPDTLELTYSLQIKGHNSPIGLDSKLDMDILVSEFNKAIELTVKKSRTNVDRQYNESVSSAVYEINFRLSQRLLVGGAQTVTLKESSFSTNFETSIARLQRRLDKYKYDNSNSTFVFTGDRTETFLGQKVDLKEGLTVKVFPEKTGTVVVYKLDYKQINDALTNKSLYSEKEASAFYQSQIDVINRILTN